MVQVAKVFAKLRSSAARSEWLYNFAQSAFWKRIVHWKDDTMACRVGWWTGYLIRRRAS